MWSTTYFLVYLAIAAKLLAAAVAALPFAIAAVRHKQGLPPWAWCGTAAGWAAFGAWALGLLVVGAGVLVVVAAARGVWV